MENRNSAWSLGLVLTIIFAILKLTDNIDWSWWWVFSPLWIEAGLALIIIGIVLIGASITGLIQTIGKKK